MGRKFLSKISVGIDLGGTNTKIALVDAKAKIISRQVMSTTDYRSKEELINGMVEVIETLISKRHLKKPDIVGIGIGTPGLVDSINGIVYGLTNIPYWVNIHLKKIFEQRLGIGTFVDNDVNVMAIGELVHGAGQGAKNVICLTLGTGVGGGIIIDGRLYRGSSLTAGEIGHIVINENGPKCMCGNYGCLERYVGNRYISQRAAEKILAGHKSVITTMVHGNLKAITPALLARAARQGDKLALSIWEETGTHIGVLLSGLVNFLNPDVIVIGGGVANAGRLIFDPIRRTIRERAMPVPAKKVRVVKAKLGKKAGIIGAATIAFYPEFRAE